MVSTVPAPPGLGVDAELPARQWPDIPLWTENYCYVCYDPGTEIGIWTHLGRAPFDPTLWRELTMVFLPTGERLVNKGYGRRETEAGPGGATLAYECVEPWRTWRSARDGASIRTSAKELDGAMAGDRAHERVAFDLTWQGHSPIWDWGDVEDEHHWGKVHYEQLCSVNGTVRVAGEEILFNGTGLRDHTRGPRDFTVISGHVWAWASFPSGRGFMLLHVVAGGRHLSRAMLLQDGRLQAVSVAQAPLLSSRDECGEGYVLDFGEARISAEVLHLLPNGFDGPNDICLGYDPAVTGTANFEGFSRFEWDGEAGYGLTERSIRPQP